MASAKQVAMAVISSLRLQRTRRPRPRPQQTSTAGRIPTEILENIFILLRPPVTKNDSESLQSLARVNRVCHSWTIAVTPILYRWVVLRKRKSVWLFMRMLRNSSSTSPGTLVRTLHISTQLAKIVHHRRHSLQSWDFPVEMKTVVDTILAKCPKLSDLSIDIPQLQEVDYRLRSTSVPSSLRMLSLTGSCVQLVDAVSSGLLPLPTLEELHLLWYGHWGNAWPPLPRLRKLTLSHLTLTESSMERLLTLVSSGLEVLSLIEVDQDITLDVRFPRLRALDYRHSHLLFGFPNVHGLHISTNETLALEDLTLNEVTLSHITLPPLRGLRRLEITSLSYMQLAEAPFHAIIDHVKESLTHLTISGFTIRGFSPPQADTLRSALRRLQKLTYLNIGETLTLLEPLSLAIHSMDVLAEIHLPLDANTPVNFLNFLPPSLQRLGVSVTPAAISPDAALLVFFASDPDISTCPVLNTLYIKHSDPAVISSPAWRAAAPVISAHCRARGINYILV